MTIKYFFTSLKVRPGILKGFFIICCIGLLGLVVEIFLPNQSDYSVMEGPVVEDIVYKYEILREWEPDNGKGYEVVLEAQNLTQEAVQAFVRGELLTKADNLVARLYSSKGAWEAEKEGNYGEIYKEGYLAYVLIKNGEIEIRWFQEKGSLERLNNTVTELK